MMHGFQQIVTQAERRYNFVVHGLPPLRDEMAVSPLIWRKRLMDSISSNLGYLLGLRHAEPRMKDIELVARFAAFYHFTYLNYKPPMKYFIDRDLETY